MNEVEFRKLFQGTPVEIRREEVFHVFVPNGQYIATIYPAKKHVEFDEDLRDLTNQGINLRPLHEYIEREGYTTNEK